jgi:hypothetical protein
VSKLPSDADVDALATAIDHAIDEHGTPNSWAPSEFAAETGLTPARIGKVMRSPMALGRISDRVGGVVTYNGRIRVARIAVQTFEHSAASRGEGWR